MIGALGHKIGMGTWPLRGSALRSAMKDALSVGYRLFDTADNYSNENDIGDILAESPSLRDQICVMTKISDEKLAGNPWSSVGKYFYRTSPYMKAHKCADVVEMLVDRSLANLHVDRLDCLLMHWPYPDYFCEIWDAMRALKSRGKIFEIGVCNCGVRHLRMLNEEFGEVPAINQISVSPVNVRSDVVDYCKDKNITVVCYAPMQQARVVDLKAPDLIAELQSKYSRSTQELLLMWCTSQGIVPIPKSSHKDRLLANYEAALDTMDEEDVKRLSALDEGLQWLPESKYCPGI